MSDTPRLAPNALAQRVSTGSGEPSGVQSADASEIVGLVKNHEALEGDKYATGGGLVQPPLALAGKPPVPDAPLARGASLLSGGQALRSQALRTSGQAEDPGSQGHATPASLKAQAEEGAEIANDGIAAAVNKAYAMMGKSSAEDEARHRRTATADIAKAIRAGHRHIDNDHAMRERGDRLQRAGITEGSKNPAVRLAQLHRASQPGWTGGASEAVSETLDAASEAATDGLPAFAVGRRDLQG